MGHVEAVLFASAVPVPRETLARVVGPECRLDALIADIRDELRARPYERVAVAGGWQLRTRTEFAPAIRAVSTGEPSADRSISTPVAPDGGPPSVTVQVPPCPWADRASPSGADRRTTV